MDTSLFTCTINEMKVGTPVWEDFIIKSTKFHAALKATIVASTAFLDSFQKIADMATSTRGGTKDVGSALTRLCLRHRSVEAKLKSLTASIMDCLIMPLQDRLEEWKKTTAQLDKEHAKECKRFRSEMKKKTLYDGLSFGSNSSTLKFQRRLKGSSAFNSAISNSLSKSMDSVEGADRMSLFEEMEKKAARRALIEVRSRFCIFVSYLRNVVDEELGMFQEMSHLKEIMDSLTNMTNDPFVLPSSCEHVISDIKMNSNGWNIQITPPSSPSSFGSRKSSMCSISSFNSSSSGSTQSPSHYRYRSLSQPYVGPAPSRMLSISSQDSGFISQPDNCNVNIGNLTKLPYYELEKNNSHHYNSNRIINCEVSSLSEHSSESAASESVAGTKDWADRPHTISTHEKVRPSLTSTTFEPLDRKNKNVSPSINVPVEEKQNESSDLDRTLTETNYGVTRYGRYIRTSERKKLNQNSYANVETGEETNLACSEGSITPTNTERCSSPVENHSELHKENRSQDIYSSTGTLSRGKPPPPPVRKTSSLSDPNAITFGTLKSAGVSTYEEIKTLKHMSSEIYEELTKVKEDKLSYEKQGISSSMSSLTEPIYSKLDGHCDEKKGINININIKGNGTYGRRTFDRVYSSSYSDESRLKSEYEQARGVFEAIKSKTDEDNDDDDNDNGGDDMPPPPIEAYTDTGEHYFHSQVSSRIANSRREFLQTLNEKLAVPVNQRISPRLTKRRSMSLPHSDDWEDKRDEKKEERKERGSKDDRYKEDKKKINETSQKSFTSSIVKRLSGNASSSYFKRHKSPESSHKFQVGGYNLGKLEKESHLQTFNSKIVLNANQQSEVAKAAAIVALKRKQSFSESDSMVSTNITSKNSPKQGPSTAEFSKDIQIRTYQSTQVCSNAKNLSRRSSQPSIGSKQSATRQLQNSYQNELSGSNTKNEDDFDSITSNQSEYMQRSTKTNGPLENFESAIAARVHNWLAGRADLDIKSCRETLMDQIRKGKVLRKVASCNDRSAPKI